MNRGIFEPSDDLSALVRCYWTLESPKESTPERNTIVPDGTMKMIFHYGDPYCHYPEGSPCVTLPRCFVIGQLTKPYTVQPTGKTGIFFVCFHPNGFSPFAAFPIKEMENTAVPLNKLFGQEGDRLGHQIVCANSTSERIALAEDFLVRRITQKHTIDEIVRSTVESILTANGQLSVEDLSKRNHINRRQLVRKFSSSVGLSPKQLSKTIRLQATLKMLLTRNVESFTNLAHENEYFDQAHFIKEFKEFTGVTPKEFYGDLLKMSLIFDSTD